MTLNITDKQQDQAKKLAIALFTKMIVGKRFDLTVALMTAEDIMTFCLGAMCPACRDEHWCMLETHFASLRSRAENLHRDYREAYPDKLPSSCAHLQ